MAIILLIIGLGLGFFLGHKYGSYFTKKLNSTLTEQVSLMRNYVQFWSEASQDRSILTQQIGKEQSENLSMTVKTINMLLQSIKEQSNNLNTHDQEKIQHLIEEARSIASPK